MPSNKIGGLKTGQGLRRIEKQREGGWRDQEARDNYEVGEELEPARSSPGRRRRTSRWGREDR